jgi:hypothetical protein
MVLVGLGNLDIARGKYSLSLGYTNKEVLEQQGLVPVWVGEMETAPLQIEIK